MRLFAVDAFASTAFKGNPVAVCLLESPRTGSRIQAVAAEMSLSRTAFLHGDTLRCFTPTVEVTLRGHAPLATAYVLYWTGAAGGRLEFHTASGTLTVNRLPDSMITMDFPSKDVSSTPVPEGLKKAHGAAPVRAGKSNLDPLVELEPPAAVQTLTPDIDAPTKIDA